MLYLPLQSFVVLWNSTHFTRQHFGVVCLFSFLSLSPLWRHAVVFSLYSDTPWPSQVHFTLMPVSLPQSPQTHTCLSFVACTEWFFAHN